MRQAQGGLDAGTAWDDVRREGAGRRRGVGGGVRQDVPYGDEHHHERAIDVAKTGQTEGKVLAAKTLADSIVKTQQSEIDEMVTLPANPRRVPSRHCHAGNTGRLVAVLPSRRHRVVGCDREGASPR